MTLPLREPRTLDDLLNYRLLRLFALGGAPVIRLLEGRYGIARREWRVLALLAAHGAMAPSLLAERAHLDRPRTSRALSALVAKGLVLRTVVARDARRARVEQTLREIGLVNKRHDAIENDGHVQAQCQLVGVAVEASRRERTTGGGRA